MPATSQYLQISDYILVEYIYSDQIISTSQARCLRIQNKYTNTYQFLNNAQAYKRTGNILDKSCSRLGTDSQAWAYHDIDVPVPTIQTDPNFVLEDLSANLAPNQYYDTIKVHFLAGFTFPGLDGVITEIQFNEWTANGTNSRPFSAASYVYLKSEPSITFSPEPIFVGDRYFDRYVEFKVPSLYRVNQDYWTSPAASNTIGYQYTFGNVGFLQNSQISVNIYEIVQINEKNGNRFLRSSNFYNGVFAQQDEYSFLGAVIKESEENDYIEYYPTYQGGFIEDYINLLNATGSWVVIHQLTVYEQIGTSFAKTSDITVLQDSNFDQPSVYRPVIRNAGTVYSYSIEYVMRLLNKVDNKEILRRANYSSTDVKKWGGQIERINVLQGFRPIKVYNKIVKNDEAPPPNISFGAPRFITQYNYVNNYYDVNYISVDSTTDISSVIGETVYPQGKNLFYMNPFDNYVKFKIFTKSQDKKQNVTMDLASTGMNIKLSFVYDDKSQIFIDPTQDIQAANPGAGEVLFRIDSTISIKLLGGKTREYYLVNRTKEGDDVLVYSGKFEDASLRDSTESAINRNMEIVKQLEDKINALKAAQESLQTQPTQVVTVGTTTAVEPVVTETVSSPTTQIIAIQNNASALDSNNVTDQVLTQTAAVQEVIVSAASTPSDIPTINIPEVPGVTPPLTKANWATIEPIVENPSGQNVSFSTATGGGGRVTREVVFDLNSDLGVRISDDNIL